LILGGGRDLVLHGQRHQEARNLAGAHLGGVPLAVEEDEPPDPVDVGFLGPPTVVPGADGLPDPVEEAGPGRSGRAWFAHDPRCECCRRVAETGSG